MLVYAPVAHWVWGEGRLAAVFVGAAVSGARLAEGRSIADQLAIQITDSLPSRFGRSV